MRELTKYHQKYEKNQFFEVSFPFLTLNILISVTTRHKLASFP